MKNQIIFFVFLLTSFCLNSQTNIQVEIPEAYELSNIILALTDYGRNDESEVQKNSSYYKEMLAFFEPVKDHPLLKKVNYSREFWEDYLSFRTDAAAFDFKNNKLKRSFSFTANPGHKPFDKNLELVNDFVTQSGFRVFYKNHKKFYDDIIENYSGYYMLDEMMAFLKKECGNIDAKKTNEEYKIILSPLVGRMNCHRNISASMAADFPSLALALINDSDLSKLDNNERAIEIHTLFTETDHGFVNPISDKFAKEMNAKIGYDKWQIKSGYPGINIFNEYMTWAVYDLFILKYFPAIADSVCTQWHYQNGERGFFASSAFANKLIALHKAKGETETLADLYPKMIGWCSEFQKDLSLPVIVSPIEPVMVQNAAVISVEILFSEPMQEKEMFDLNVIRGPEKERTFLNVTKAKNNITWSNNGQKLRFEMAIGAARQITLQTNWWGCKTPLESKKGIMLKVFSKVVIKQ